MLLTVQHPICDLRMLRPSGARIARPVWPLPSTSDFIRNFGGIEERRLGGQRYWGETRICSIRNGVKFPKVPSFRYVRSDYKSRKIGISLTFRRFFGSAFAAGKFEIGIASCGRFTLDENDALGLLRHVLGIEGQVVRPNKEAHMHYIDRIGDLGSSIAQSYLEATTRASSAGEVSKSDVVAGHPVMFIHRSHHEALALPLDTIADLVMPQWGVRLRCFLVSRKGTPFRIWDLELGEGANKTIARELRIAILRLHSEHFAVETVCHEVLTRDPSALDDVEIATRLTKYLDTSLDDIAGKVKVLRHLTKEDYAVLEMSHRAYDTIRPGERTDLLALLQRAQARPNLLRKVDRYIFQQFNIEEMRIAMADEIYQSFGTAVGFGHDVKIDTVNMLNNTVSWDQFATEADPHVLSQELKQLMVQMKESANRPEQYATLGALATALQAIEEKDAGKVMQYLKKSGEWAFKCAQDLGVDLVAGVISKSLGM